MLSVPSRLLICYCLLVLVACQPGEWQKPKTSDTIKLLHLSHPRMETDAEFNQDLKKIDYSAYDVLLLGGDMAYNSSGERSTMDSLQKIFSLDRGETLWSLGNHDYHDLDLLEEYTGRPNFYTYSKDKITFLVLDTDRDSSSFKGAQLDLINSVLDTLSTTTHLILLHHQLIWFYGNEDLMDDIYCIPNGRFGDCLPCIKPNNFYDEIYPRLLEVKERGIEVYCVAGDLGRYVKTFYYPTPEGIHFIGSGLRLKDDDNTVLLFEYDRKKATLDWSFRLLKDLY